MKISIITASFNCKEHLKRTIYSVQSQLYKNFEHIIIDGNSSDGTDQIFTKNVYPNTFFYSENDSGIYDAFNKGIERASGDLIGFLNSDDTYCNKYVLSDMTEIFNVDNHDFVYGDINMINEEHKLIRSWKSDKIINYTKIKNGFMVPHPSLYVKRDLIKSLKFNDNYLISADYDFMLRLFNITKKGAYINKPVVNQILGGASNGSLKKDFLRASEDFKITKTNNLNPYRALPLKIFRKIPQFFR